MKRNGTRYDLDFKKMVVDLYNTTDHTLKTLESEYGVTSATIQRWVKLYSPISQDNPEAMTPKEIADLKKEMAKMKEENEILKKAMAILAKK